jgi:molybdopterin/thiamine biosynthesis adenylyltransferase/outer membrane protein assembly factor BamB
LTEVPEDRIFSRHPRLGGAVLIVGAGAVGGLTAQQLTYRGVTRLTIVDYDTVDWDNISRQPYVAGEVGQLKALALAERIPRDFPPCEVIGIPRDFTKMPSDEQRRLVREADVVVAATDEVPCQRRVNQVCLEVEKPAVFPAVWVDRRIRDAEVGEILWVLPGRNTPCYECWVSFRQASADAQAARGARIDIELIALATAQVVAALLNPTDLRSGILDPERTAIYIHGLTPTSPGIRRTFPTTGLQSRNVRVPFPATACRACRGHEPPEPIARPAPRPAPAERVAPAPEPEGWRPPGMPPIAGPIGLLIVLALVGILIVWRVSADNHNHRATTNAKAAASAASTQAALAAERIAWQAPAIFTPQNVLPGGLDMTAVSVAEGHVYCMVIKDDGSGVIIESLDAASGRLEWRYTSSGQGVYEDRTPPALVGTSVIGHDGSSVFALDVKTGELRWSKDLGEGGAFAINSDNGIVIAWGIGGISAYRADTGADAWAHPYPSALSVVKGVSTLGSRVVILRDYTLVSLDIETGDETWIAQLDNDPVGAMGGIDSDQIIIRNRDALEAHNLSNGTRTWRDDGVADNPPAPGGPPYLTVSSQIVLVHTCVNNQCPNNSGPVRTAYDARSGSRLWGSPCDCDDDSGFAWLPDNRFLGWNTGTSSVDLVNAGTGAVEWSRSFGNFSPESAAGDASRVYLVDHSGAVLATAR